MKVLAPGLFSVRQRFIHHSSFAHMGLVAFATTCSVLNAASPVLGTPAAFPSIIVANISMSVSVTVPIPSPPVTGGVNLMQVVGGSMNPIILGQMHDDGQNGDLTAHDGIYTVVVAFNLPVSVSQLQVSAAFPGVLRRVLSTPVILASTPDGKVQLPPDPGPAGMITLNGIDSDGDGLRDDVQRYIALTYPSSAAMRSALTQLARGYLLKIADNLSPQLAALDSESSRYAVDCLFFSDQSATSQALLGLESLILNTQSRINAYLVADSAASTASTTAVKGTMLSARCMVNPNTLPN